MSAFFKKVSPPFSFSDGVARPYHTLEVNFVVPPARKWGRERFNVQESESGNVEMQFFVVICSTTGDRPIHLPFALGDLRGGNVWI